MLEIVVLNLLINLYDTKRKEFVFDTDHNLLAEMEKES